MPPPVDTAPHILILASERGKRMRSHVPKAVHPVLFRPMIHYVLDLAQSIPHRSITVVLDRGEEEVERRCEGIAGIKFLQREGSSGNALRQIAPALKNQSGPVLILNGDLVLLGPSSVKKMIEKHVREEASCTIGSTVLDFPIGNGRAGRLFDTFSLSFLDESNGVNGERSINEVNAGIYCFQAPDLLSALGSFNGKSSLEQSFSDLAKRLVSRKKRAVPFLFADPIDVMGIDDRRSLHIVETILQERVNTSFMQRGVTIQDPKTTWIDPRCKIAEDVRIEGGTILIRSIIEEDVTVESQCRIVDSWVGYGTQIKQGSYIEQASIGYRCTIGPYAHLRPKCRLGAGVKIGNFVELKQSTFGAGSKASHLSYVGDAEVGKNVNFGCGFITCNFDGGPIKHKTSIEDDVFIGSDCQTVAPVKLGRGSYIAAGTTVTENVPPDSLAIGRGRQVTKPGYAKKYRRPKSDHAVAPVPVS